MFTNRNEMDINRTHNEEILQHIGSVNRSTDSRRETGSNNMDQLYQPFKKKQDYNLDDQLDNVKLQENEDAADLAKAIEISIQEEHSRIEEEEKSLENNDFFKERNYEQQQQEPASSLSSQPLSQQYYVSSQQSHAASKNNKDEKHLSEELQMRKLKSEFITKLRMMGVEVSLMNIEGLKVDADVLLRTAKYNVHDALALYFEQQS